MLLGGYVAHLGRPSTTHPSRSRDVRVHPGGVTVLDDVTMTFPRSGVVALRAANGAGKSTLVELVSGHLTPQKGRVEICGHPADSPAARGFRRVVRTKPALYPTMNVFDHLTFTAKLADVPIDDVLSRVRARLDEWLDVRAYELSSGTERKLWLIVCTLGRFEAVVLDEPFLGLDDHARGVLWSEMDRWRAKDRLVIVATHEHPQDFYPDAEYQLAPGKR